MVVILILSHLAVAAVSFCLGGVGSMLLAKRLAAAVLNKEMAAKFGHELRAERRRADLAKISVRHQEASAGAQRMSNTDCGGMSKTSAPVAAEAVLQNSPPNRGPSKGPGALSTEQH